MFTYIQTDLVGFVGLGKNYDCLVGMSDMFPTKTYIIRGFKEKLDACDTDFDTVLFDQLCKV